MLHIYNDTSLDSGFFSLAQSNKESDQNYRIRCMLLTQFSEIKNGNKNVLNYDVD